MVCFFCYQEKWNKLKSWWATENDVKRGKIATLELYKNTRGSYHRGWSSPCLSSGGRWRQDVCSWPRREAEGEMPSGHTRSLQRSVSPARDSSVPQPVFLGIQDFMDLTWRNKFLSLKLYPLKEKCLSIANYHCQRVLCLQNWWTNLTRAQKQWWGECCWFSHSLDIY